MTKHEESCIREIKRLQQLDIKWYELLLRFFRWCGIRELKQSIRAVRRFNGNYDRRIDI